MCFRFCVVGAPGCCHDARVWRNSSLFRRLLNNVSETLYYVLGDPAYALLHFWYLLSVPLFVGVFVHLSSNHVASRRMMWNQTNDMRTLTLPTAVPG